MSELPSSIGIHEFLRYAIPGYSLLFLSILPFVLTNPALLQTSNWEIGITFFIFGGLVVGYIVYYEYYLIFRKVTYTPKKRKSIQRTLQLLGKTKSDFEVLAIQGMALSKEKGSIKEPVLFQFSIFHSIGSLIPSIWIGYVLSTLFGKIWIESKMFWNWEFAIFFVLILVTIFLIIEYSYRSKLAIEIEDQIALRHLEEVVNEFLGKRDISVV